jgi:transposase
MLFPEAQLRIWLYAQPCDMRRSYDGLSALAKQHLGEDPLSGQLFVFLNRRQTQVKILYFDRSGYCIWSKRLEQGRFRAPPGQGDKVALDWTRLKLILEGIEVQKIRQRKRHFRSVSYPSRV